METMYAAKNLRSQHIIRVAVIVDARRMQFKLTAYGHYCILVRMRCQCVLLSDGMMLAKCLFTLFDH